MPRDTRTFPLPIASLPSVVASSRSTDLVPPRSLSSQDQMNKLSVFALSAFLVLFAMVIRAQEQHPAPKPGPEHAKLAYFARKWVSEAEVKPSAFGPGG